MFDLLPVGVRALEEAIQVDVVHEYDSECCCEAGETPGPPYSAFEHHQQQVGDVLLFPDNGMYDKWFEKGKTLSHMFKRLRISALMEREAESPGDDIGDLILRRYREWVDSKVGDVPIDLALTDI